MSSLEDMRLGLQVLAEQVHAYEIKIRDLGRENYDLLRKARLAEQVHAHEITMLNPKRNPPCSECCQRESDNLMRKHHDL